MTKARDLGNFVAGTNSAITTTQIDDDAVTNAKIANESITINGSAVNLGGSVTVGETKPTISSISPSVIENTHASVYMSGAIFVSVPPGVSIGLTGAIGRAYVVSFSSSTSILAKFTLPVDGTYFVRVENNDGNAVRSSSALLTVSEAPAWTTSAGSLGSNAAGSSVSYTVAATNATSFAVQSGSLPGSVSLNTSTGAITGTESGATSETTYSFTIRATDAQGQTADRAFSITITVGINNSGQFNYANIMATTKWSITAGTPTSSKKFTISYWVKRSNIGSAGNGHIFDTYVNSTNRSQIHFDDDNVIDFRLQVSGSNTGRLKTNRVFRDTSAWYHIVASVDTTLGTADDRVKLYINGVQETSFSSRTNPSQKKDFPMAGTQTLGAYGGGTEYLAGTVAHVDFRDGNASGRQSLGEHECR